VNGRVERYQRGGILLLLVALHFVVPEFVGLRMAPDFLLLALLVYAIRARPGPAAVAGFLTGLVADALTPAALGAGAFAYTVVGYLAAWGKAVFFAENLVVNAGLVFAGVWIRDLLVLVIGRPTGGDVLLWQLILWSPLRALTTAAAALVVSWMFRRALEVRILE
jgi:rod shape-determining protein MreD